MGVRNMSSIEKLIIDFLDQYKDTYVPIDLVASALKMGNPRDKKRLNKTINKSIINIDKVQDDYNSSDPSKITSDMQALNKLLERHKRIL